MNTEQNPPKFKIGDVVEIIGYGSLAWIPKSEYDTFPVVQETETHFIVDVLPNEVGAKGAVQEITTSQERIRYSLFKSGKQAWFNEEQLKLIE